MEGTRQIVHLLVYPIKLRKVIIIIACLLIVLTLGYQRSTDQDETLYLLQQANSAVTEFESLSGRYPAYQIWDDNSQTLGYAVIAHASGYGGELSVLSMISNQGVIENTIVINHIETPLYLKRVIESGFTEQLKGTSVSEFLRYGEEIDGVSGATMTAKAILNSIQRGGAQIGSEQLGLSVHPPDKYTVTLPDFMILLLVLLSILFPALRWNKLRPWFLLSSVVIFGFWLNVSLSLANFTSLMSGNYPSILERPIWYVLVPGILIVTLLWGKNFYCSWLCPFGAVQEGIYKALNLTSYKPNSGLRHKVATTRGIIIWMAVIIALISNNASIAGYEPFYVFFDSRGNTGQWVIMGMVLLLSIGVMRIWCRGFCPVGTILDFLAAVKRKLKKRFKIEDKIDVANEEVGEKTASSNADKLLGACLVIIYLAIVWSIIQNILL